MIPDLSKLKTKAIIAALCVVGIIAALAGYKLHSALSHVDLSIDGKQVITPIVTETPEQSRLNIILIRTIARQYAGRTDSDLANLEAALANDPEFAKQADERVRRNLGLSHDRLRRIPWRELLHLVWDNRQEIIEPLIDLLPLVIQSPGDVGMVAPLDVGNGAPPGRVKPFGVLP